MSADKSLIVQSVLAQRDKQPYVQIMLDGKDGQFTPEEARAFGMQLIAAACAAEADAAIYRFITRELEAPEEAAAAVMQAFRNVRQESQQNPARQEWNEVD